MKALELMRRLDQPAGRYDANDPLKRVMLLVTEEEQRMIVRALFHYAADHEKIENKNA